MVRRAYRFRAEQIRLAVGLAVGKISPKRFYIRDFLEVLNVSPLGYKKNRSNGTVLLIALGSHSESAHIDEIVLCLMSIFAILNGPPRYK